MARGHSIAAVLFDFDGVIVNSEPLHLQTFQAVLGDEKIALTEDEYYDELVGFDDRGAFKYIFEKNGKELDAKTLLRVMARKSEAMMELIHRKRYAALRGAEEFIRGVWRHYPLAICSGALREEIEATLEGIALRDCFPIIVAAEDVTRGKPDPQCYEMAVWLIEQRTKKSLAAKDCLVVEDAPSVIRNVRKAGFRVLGVASSYEHEELEAAGAEHVVNTLELDEVEKVLPQLKTRV